MHVSVLALTDLSSTSSVQFDPLPAGSTSSTPQGPTANYHIDREDNYGTSSNTQTSAVAPEKRTLNHTVSFSCKHSHGCQGNCDMIVMAISKSWTQGKSNKEKERRIQLNCNLVFLFKVKRLNLSS